MTRAAPFSPGTALTPDVLACCLKGILYLRGVDRPLRPGSLNRRCVLRGLRALDGQREKERRTFARLRLGPDPAVLRLHDPAANCQANAGPRVFLGRVQSLEGREYGRG